MTNTLLMIAALAGIMGIIAYLNAKDIETCVNKGHSEEVCSRIFNR